MRLYKYICFFSFFLSLFASAQDDPFAEDAYEPDSLYAVRNAIKVDPLQIVVGEYQLIYERILANRWSVEFGLGFTRRNYLADRTDYTLDDLGRNVDIKTKYSFTLSFRRYFMNTEELLGPYVALGGNIREYAFDYAVLDSTGTLTGDNFDDVRKFTSGFINIGYQALPKNSNIFADFYVGVAIRYAELQILNAEDVNDPTTFFYTPIQEYRWGFNVGIKIGVGF